MQNSRFPKRIYAIDETERNNRWDWCFWLFAIPFGVLAKGILSKDFLVTVLSLLLFFLIVWLLHRNFAPKTDEGIPDDFVYVDPGHGIYPPAPDPGKIRHGRDSITKIVGDRINVLLEKKNEKTGYDFQVAFKKLYPGPEYKFVYFDSLTYRLQVMIPEEKYNFIMDSLNSQMPEFSFLLFDETVFGVNGIPNDPAINNPNVWHFRAIKAFDAWNITTGDKKIKIGVVDNGFDLNHVELKGRYVDEYNMAEHNTNVYAPPGFNIPFEHRCPGHGTHVAAICAGAMNNSNGACGIAPGCTLVPVQVADYGGIMTLTSVLDGVLYAIYKECDVVNISLGSSGVPDEMQNVDPSDQLSLIQRGIRTNEERVWDMVFKIAHDKNCTLVFAAGNENILSGFDPMKRNNDCVIVSAVDKNMRKASFSNYGNYVQYNYSTISAPGTEILSAMPGNKYEFLQGTSQAAPIVTGSIALMKSLNKNLTTKDVIEILQKTGLKSKDPIGNHLNLYEALKTVRVNGNN